jgi:hypothetical protein
MPGFCCDPLEELGQSLRPRPWGKIPSVGFCGFVSNPFMRGLYRVLGRERKSEGLALRAKALRSLVHPGVKTDFIRRNAYWAGTAGRFHHKPAAQAQPRREFLDNLMGSDYMVCLRGAGNFSFRLYEALAAGRIPLFINTKCVLPFEDQIDWRRHVVWIEQDDMEHAAERLLEFHGSLNDEQFRAVQVSNRRLWEEFLSPLGFFRKALTPT